MNRKIVGVVDYGLGNHASVRDTFKSLDYRCIISSDPEFLSGCDLILLPGVGAFPAAMSAMRDRGLISFLCTQARSGQPIVGLCLGMQLLAESSLEHGLTEGLGLIPGQVIPLEPDHWHIGWNTIEVINQDKLLLPSHGESVYFNHSYVFAAPEEYQIATAQLKESFPVAVRLGNIVGLQFHPEKSQLTGRAILKNLVDGLTDA